MKNLALLLLVVASVITFANRSTPPAPATGSVAPSPSQIQFSPSESDCHPNYSGCLDPYAVDYDCIGGNGNGPLYTGEVRIRGRDVFQLDSDGDGIGCDGR